MQNLDSVFDGAERSTPNPFLNDVFTPGITELPGVAAIHETALNRCVRACESLLQDASREGGSFAPGRTLLIASPRAGYGKSHLLGRIHSVTESLIGAFSLPFDPLRPVTWESFLDSLTNQYRSTGCPQSPTCTLFDETARFFQSTCVRTALEYGALAEREIPETEIAMRVQFRDVFDPKAGNRMTSWFAKKASILIDSAATGLCARWSLGFDDLVFWNQVFLDHAHPKSNPFAHFEGLSSELARQRLMEFLRIGTSCRPAVFIADHLDGFFGSENAGMEIGGILTTLREEAPRSVTLLCLNEDLWNSIFEERIPTAWIDRLTADSVPLKGISAASAEALLRSRLSAAGVTGPGADGFLRHFAEIHGWSGDGTEASIYPRQLLRQAASMWDEAPKQPAPASARGASDSVTRGTSAAPPQPLSPPSTGPSSPTHRDATAAARAAGKDVTRATPNIESLIAEIRGSGARAVSENTSRLRQESTSSAPEGNSVESRPGNPFWAKNLEDRLHELESELSASGEISWKPERLAHLVRSVGDRFPAVGQERRDLDGECLCWTVRNYRVLLGFERPANLSFWRAVLQRAISMEDTEAKKIAVLSHASEPFDFRALVGIGMDSATLSRYFDVIDLTETDLRRLYAAELLLRESEAAGQGDGAVRVIARRLDPFWRRLTRPIAPVEAAG